MRQPTVRDIQELIRFLNAEAEHEEEHIRAISGPTGSRAGQAVSMAVARNDVRRQVIDRLEFIIK